MKRLLRFAAFALLACIGIAEAGVFSVTPVRIFMAPRDRAIAVTVTNEGDEEIVMQADVYSWKQKPDGEDDLALSEDLILSPPIIKLAAKSRQVVRLAMVRPPAATQQLTYRMIVREIPEARQAPEKIQLQVALAFSLPVFITPPGAKSQLKCLGERAAADTVRAVCENTGSAYAQLRDFTLTNAGGEKLAQRETGGYVLPGIKRSFEIKRPEGPFPKGSAKLVVNLDDGSSQTYEVSLAE